MFGGGGDGGSSSGGGGCGGEEPNALLNCMSGAADGGAADGGGETVARLRGLFGRSRWKVARKNSPKTIRLAMISK